MKFVKFKFLIGYYGHSPTNSETQFVFYTSVL